MATQGVTDGRMDIAYYIACRGAWPNLAQQVIDRHTDRVGFPTLQETGSYSFVLPPEDSWSTNGHSDSHTEGPSDSTLQEIGYFFVLPLPSEGL